MTSKQVSPCAQCAGFGWLIVDHPTLPVKTWAVCPSCGGPGAGKTPLEPLINFLYVLLRDHLPSGVVEGIMVNHVEKARGRTRSYSNPHVEAHAREIAERLLRRAPGSDE